MVWGQIPHDQQRCSPELKPQCSLSMSVTVLRMFYRAQQPTVAQYLGLLFIQGLVCVSVVLCCLLPPEPDRRETRDCPGWGAVIQQVAWVESSTAGVLWQLQIPPQLKPRAQGRAAFLCHSQALPCAPEESCCCPAWARSSWGKAFVQINYRTFFQSLSICLEQALQMSSGVCWRLLDSV